MYARPLVRLALLALATAALAGCPSLSQRAERPPSIDRAQALEGTGDRAGAARVYEQLAAQNAGTDRTGLLLQAARDYLAAQRIDDAARVLGQTQGPFSAEQTSEHTLLSAEVMLARGQPQEALRLLNAIPVPAAADQAARYRAARASASALVAGRGEGGKAIAAATTGPHIALLLPVTGRAAAAAISVRDGFMTAYYQVPPAERPRVQIYDTGSQSIAYALSKALAFGRRGS